MTGWREILQERGPVGVMELIITRLDALATAVDALAQSQHGLEQQQQTRSDENGQGTTDGQRLCDSTIDNVDSLDNG